MKSDLHMHSKFSDGHQWPEEIADKAKKMDFEMAALTDHDTMAGVDRFLKACDKQGIIGIPAVEIDYDDKQEYFKSELLGYFPGMKYDRTQRILNDLQEMRKQIAVEAISYAAGKYNRKDLSFIGLLKQKLNEPLLNLADLEDQEISVTKPDLLKYFIAENIPVGYSLDDYPSFRKEFFDQPVFSGIRSSKPDLIDCIRTISEDGGFAVMAHPALHYKSDLGKMKEDRSNCLSKFRHLKQHGLWGIELHSYDPDRGIRIPLNNFFKDIADELGLNLTYGSDTHGAGDDKDMFGKFYGDFRGFTR